MSQSTEPQILTDDAKGEIIASIASLMVEHYVFPEVGFAAGRSLVVALKSEEYENIVDYEQFAKFLTTELRASTQDKHMSVRLKKAVPGVTEGRPVETHFVQSKVLSENIGYLKFDEFLTLAAAQGPIRQAMRTIEDTNAVIFDLRENIGGSAKTVQLLCSFLFSETVHLNSLYWRKGDKTEEFWTIADVGGKKRPTVPVFVLTSKRTFSAAEEFSYNLQTRQRATIVGDITGGGANPGDRFEVCQRLEMFVPMGRAINPVTNDNWEGVGVRPDVEVDATKALEVAIELAKNNLGNPL